jgi:hypothetical protein
MATPAERWIQENEVGGAQVGSRHQRVGRSSVEVSSDVVEFEYGLSREERADVVVPPHKFGIASSVRGSAQQLTLSAGWVDNSFASAGTTEGSHQMVWPSLQRAHRISVSSDCWCWTWTPTVEAVRDR